MANLEVTLLAEGLINMDLLIPKKAAPTHHTTITSEEVSSPADRSDKASVKGSCNSSDAPNVSQQDDQPFVEKRLSHAIKHGRLRTLVFVCSALYLSLVGIIAYFLTR